MVCRIATAMTLLHNQCMAGQAHEHRVEWARVIIQLTKQQSVILTDHAHREFDASIL